MEAIAIQHNETQFGYYAQLSGVTTKKQLEVQIKTLAAELEFSHYSFIDMRFPIYRPICNYPNSIHTDLRHDILCENNPIFDNARINNKPFFISYLQNELEMLTIGSSSKLTFEKIYGTYKRHGFYNLLFIPIEQQYLFTVGKQGKFPLGFEDEYSGHVSSVKLLAEAIQYTLTTKFSECLPSLSNIEIGVKPLAVLNELANTDETICEIADRLCISRITANHHLKTVRNALGTKTNNAAIKKAILYKLIQFDRDYNCQNYRGQTGIQKN